MDLNRVACRCCLRYECDDMKDLIELWTRKLSYKDMLEYLVDSTLSLDYANRICAVCELELIEAYNFKRKCIKSLIVISDALNTVFVGETEPNKILDEEDSLIEFDEDVNIADEQCEEENIEFGIDGMNSNCQMIFGSILNDHVEQVELVEEVVAHAVENFDIKVEEDEDCEDIPLNENHEIPEVVITDEDIAVQEVEENNCKTEVITNENSKIIEVTTTEQKCCDCEMIFDTVVELRDHYRNIHKYETCSICAKCDMCFTYRTLYNRHYNSKHMPPVRKKYVKKKYRGEKNECALCDIKFPTIEDYKKHAKQEHFENVVCDLCGKMVSVTYIRAHRLFHSKERKHKCNECGKAFIIFSHLASHMRVHRNDRRYECEYCGKKFLHWGTRRYHVLAVHTGEKNFKCDLCERAFTAKGHLVIHMRTHTGEKPYSCTLCPKKFRSSNVMRRHKLFHEQNSPTTCEICKKVCISPAYLKNHMETHSKHKFCCPVCMKKFKKEYRLKGHMKVHSEK